MPLNWGNIWPGGEPFYTPTQTQDDRVVPTSGYENLDVTGRAQTNYDKKNAAMRALIEQNPDQLGTIQNTGQVNKMSMIPDNFIENMKRLYGGITSTDAAKTMNTGNKYANLADEAWANKMPLRTPGGNIVADTESGEVYPDIASFPENKIQETDQWRLPDTDWGPVRPTEPLPQRGKMDMFLQKFGVPPMTQVSDADRTANQQFMVDQQMGRDQQTGRMYGGDWNEASRDFEGMNPAGESGWGSANFGEMSQNWMDRFGDVEYSQTPLGAIKRRKQARMKQRAAEFATQQQAAQAERIRNERATASAANQMTQRRPGRGGDHMSRSRDQGGLGLTTTQAQAVSDANRSAGMGGWNLAYGGRVGYNKGGRVGILSIF